MKGQTNCYWKDPHRLMLFNYGNVYQETTGGYSTTGYSLSGYSNAGNISIIGDHIDLHPGTSNVVSIFGSNQSFDCTNYKKLTIIAYITSAVSFGYLRLGLPTVKTEGYNQEFASGAQQPTRCILNTLTTYEWNITSLNGFRYMMFNNHDGGAKCSGQIYKVWLE